MDATKFFIGDEIEEKLGLSPRTARRWVKAGKMPGFLLPDGEVRISEAEFTAWLESKRLKPPVRGTKENK